MQRKNKSFPLNPMAEMVGAGIFIGRASANDQRMPDQASLDYFEMAAQSHRDDYHFFIIQETGNSVVEIDFTRYKIKSPAIIYIHPGQVHRLISFKDIAAGFLAISAESVQPEYLKLLQDITPARPLTLKKEELSIFVDLLALCLRLSERKGEKLQHYFLKDGCNALIGSLISQYVKQSGSSGKLSRCEAITKAFRAILEKSFIISKRPAEYAAYLNISVAYLNECVKKTTGYPVSRHIQQRIILEAKRMLYHSDKSVKEIAVELGYDDYSYFSRLFASVAGVSALVFKKQHRD